MATLVLPTVFWVGVEATASRGLRGGFPSGTGTVALLIGRVSFPATPGAVAPARPGRRSWKPPAPGVTAVLTPYTVTPGFRFTGTPRRALATRSR
ncbi:hypothetical protein GCM10023192_84460 [Amycolatopsis samaneae]